MTPLVVCYTVLRRPVAGLHRVARRFVRHHPHAALATILAPPTTVCVAIPAWLAWSVPPAIERAIVLPPFVVPEPNGLLILAGALCVLMIVREVLPR